MLISAVLAFGAIYVSNRLIDTFLAALPAGDVTVTQRDLDADPVPHVTSATLAGIGRPAPETAAAKPTRAFSDRLIAELRDADLIVLGVPMYNFGIPSTLKSWFDHVLRAGETFRYTAEGPEGLLPGKRAVILASRAGAYSGSPVDHQVPHAATMLGFMGVTNVDTIIVEGLAFGEEAAARAIAQGEAQTHAIADSFMVAA